MEKEIKHCKRCGRKLRSEESMERGYGNVCYKKRQTNMKPLFNLCEKSS